MPVYTLTNFNIEFVRTTHNSKVFVQNYDGLDCNAPESYSHQVMQAWNQNGQITLYGEQWRIVSSIYVESHCPNLYVWTTLLNIKEGTWSLYLKKLPKDNLFIKLTLVSRCIYVRIHSMKKRMHHSADSRPRLIPGESNTINSKKKTPDVIKVSIGFVCKLDSFLHAKSRVLGDFHCRIFWEHRFMGKLRS